jgi:O-antigen/teichoic acid export membrane protein
MSYDKIEDALSESIIPSVFLIFPAFFGVIVFGEEILSIVFGPEFVLAQTALIILMGGKLVHAAFILLNRGLQGIGHVDSAAYATVTSVISNVLLNLILIQAFGLAGAAAATTIAFLVNSVVHYLYLHSYIDVRLPLNNLAWCLISSLFMGVLLYAVSEFVIVDSVNHLAVVVSLGAVIYFTSILLFKPFRLKIISVMDGL